MIGKKDLGGKFRGIPATKFRLKFPKKKARIATKGEEGERNHPPLSISGTPNPGLRSGPMLSGVGLSCVIFSPAAQKDP